MTRAARHAACAPCLAVVVATSRARLPMRSRPHVQPRRKERMKAPGGSSAGGSATSFRRQFNSRARPRRPAGAQRPLLVGVRLLRARRVTGLCALEWSAHEKVLHNEMILRDQVHLLNVRRGKPPDGLPLERGITLFPGVKPCYEATHRTEAHEQ